MSGTDLGKLATEMKEEAEKAKPNEVVGSSKVHLSLAEVSKLSNYFVGYDKRDLEVIPLNSEVPAELTSYIVRLGRVNYYA